MDNGSLSSVAWSADGERLYAGGTWDRNGQYPVRRWQNGGRGQYDDLEGGCINSISGLCPLADGRLAWGSADPAWGVLGADGRPCRYVKASIADYREIWEGIDFLLSPDGTTVAFGYRRGGKDSARFALDTRILSVPAGEPGNLQPPRIQGSPLSMDVDRRIHFQGPIPKLDQHESFVGVAIAPDDVHYVVGASWSLCCFDVRGVQLWRKTLPTVWAVNIAANNQVAAAAFDDGTIRWYRMRDGKELLAFFLHADRKRWVLWTPSGYYDASPGGEDLIGWHVNRGKDQAADFFPASRFRSTYYRPDVISRVLATLDEGEALRQADAESGRKHAEVSISQALPPVVRIVSPQDAAEVSAPQVAVRYTLRTPSGEPVTSVKALVDGRPVEQERDLQVVASRDAEREIRIPMPPHEATVSIVAYNRFAASEPATVRLAWKGAAATGSAFVVLPKLYVLAIGVGQYPHPDWVLRYPAKDARDFCTSLRAQKDALYREVVVKLLADKDATKDNILDGLDWIRKQTTSKDVAMVFVSGHGVNDNDGSYYFVPVNFDPDRIKRTGLSASDIQSTLAQIAGKALFFFDSCHSGNVMGSQRARALESTSIINELISAENGVVVFAASTGRQVALEDQSWGNGAFTKAVVEGLSGGADYQHTGRITVNMLDLFVSERVKALTGGRQTPTTAKPATVPDFPVAMRVKAKPHTSPARQHSTHRPKK